MPQYIAKPTQKSLKYAIFSTVVMDYITKKMYRNEMIEYLKAHKGYEGFMDPRPYNEQFPDFYNDPTAQWQRNDLARTYWNGDFWYVTEEDAYFI